MKPPTSKGILTFGIGAVLLIFLGFWLLISPQNPLFSAFRGPYRFPNDRVIIGPYPLLDEFRLMKSRGVTQVVSLLDPRLPYEKILLEEERDRAGKFKIRLENFPMVSLWGTPVGADYEGNALKAAEAIEKEEGKSYVHCYLGLHRSGTVADLLKKRGTRSAVFRSRRDPAMEDARLQTEARAAYDGKRYPQAVELVGKMRVPSLPARLLKGWALYREGKVAESREAFEEVLADAPTHEEALAGLGFCALRQDRLEEADVRFGALPPGSPTAIEGLSLLRYRQGRWKEALPLLEARIKADPGNQEAKDILEKIRGKTGPDPR